MIIIIITIAKSFRKIQKFELIKYELVLNDGTKGIPHIKEKMRKQGC